METLTSQRSDNAEGVHLFLHSLASHTFLLIFNVAILNSLILLLVLFDHPTVQQ